MAESIEPGFYEGVKALNVSSSSPSSANLSSPVFAAQLHRILANTPQVRMFHDVDVRTLQRREVDGRSL